MNDISGLMTELTTAGYRVVCHERAPRETVAVAVCCLCGRRLEAVADGPERAIRAVAEQALSHLNRATSPSVAVAMRSRAVSA